jgi:hypothetical protein
LGFTVVADVAGKKLIFTVDTSEGRLLVLDAGTGLRFIMDSSPGPAVADSLVDESDIKRFRMKSTAPKQSVADLAAHLRQWLVSRDSRGGVYRLTITPEACVGDEAVVVSGSASPPIVLNYGECADFEQAIARWLADAHR